MPYISACMPFYFIPTTCDLFVFAVHYRRTEERWDEEMRVEYKLILRDVLDGGKLDGSSKDWEKATLRRTYMTSSTMAYTFTLPFVLHLFDH